MVIPAMQLAGKIPDVHVQLWASALLKGFCLFDPVCRIQRFGAAVFCKTFIALDDADL